MVLFDIIAITVFCFFYSGKWTRFKKKVDKNNTLISQLSNSTKPKYTVIKFHVLLFDVWHR